MQCQVNKWSIDADLNAGLIDEEEARSRRQEVRREADFYGAMDGASKFVKGDAIAGIIITIVNIIGGFIIGGNARPAGTASGITKVYDSYCGWWSCKPDSGVTGFYCHRYLVTRAASAGNLGQDLTGQVLVNREFYIWQPVFWLC